MRLLVLMGILMFAVLTRGQSASMSSSSGSSSNATASNATSNATANATSNATTGANYTIPTLPITFLSGQNRVTLVGIGRAPFNYTSANISFTLFAIGSNASEAASMLNTTVENLRGTLNNITGVQILSVSPQPTFFPIYNTTGGEMSVSGYGASIDFSLLVQAADVPTVLDALRTLNSTNVRVGSVTITPDRASVERAEQVAFAMALLDATDRAQTLLAPFGLCVTNISSVIILDPLVGGDQLSNNGVPFLNQFPFLMNEGAEMGGMSMMQGMALPQIIRSENEVMSVLLVTFLASTCSSGGSGSGSGSGGM